MTDVLRVLPADSPEYVRLLVDPPVGSTQASDLVVAHAPGEKLQERPEPPLDLALTDPIKYDEAVRLRRSSPYENAVAHLHVAGQREFDVPEGCAVRFPDGTVWKPPLNKR